MRKQENDFKLAIKLIQEIATEEENDYSSLQAEDAFYDIVGKCIKFLEDRNIPWSE